MEVGSAKTPKYILRDGNNPICPSIALQSSSETEAKVVFAFSDKPEYDVFLESGSVSLMPYPLVKRFLSERLDSDKSSLQLVVIDATESEQPILFAATFQSVLDSLVTGSDSVAVSHQLMLDPSSHSYTIQAMSDPVAGKSS